MKSMRHLGSVCNSGNSFRFAAAVRTVVVVAILAPAAILIWDTAVAAEKVGPRLPDDSIIVSKRVSPVLPRAELLALRRDLLILPTELDGQTITVTTLHDISDFSGVQQVSNLPGPDGRISFREACTAANNTAGGQTIAFAIPVTEFWLLSDVALLKLEQGAFFLTDSATTVDFSTQTTNIGDTNPTGPEVGIYGLEPNGWGIAAIFMNGDNGVIKGLGKVYQRGYGVRIVGDNNRVIGCQISGPLHAALSVEGYLGGPTPTDNTVGGTALGEGNYLTGLRVGGPADNNVVIGNTIIGGVDIIGSTQYGVIARNNRIGGPTAAHRNIISGAGYYGEEGYPVGEQLSIVDADGTVVQGNYIGTTVDGMARYPQQIGPIGVEVRDSRNTTIHDNLIAGLRTVGVNHYNGQIFGWAILVGATNRSNQGANIEANTIGLAADGLTPIVTRSGITVSPLSGNYHAYGTHIVYNHIAGVETNGVVIGSQENGIIITGNSIHDSGALGIDLFSGNFGGTGGVTLNDLGDADTGGNGLQNFPVLVSSTTTGSSVTIQGTLDSSPSEQFTVEFFASPSCDPSGYGEGARFLGSTSVTTDGAGHGVFSVTAPAEVAAGSSATATTKRSATGDTSEFSGCTTVISTSATPTATPTPTPTSTPTSTPTATPTATPTPTPTPMPGMEGDVAPRPNGDGVTMATDVTQLRRFAAGLDTPVPASNEAQRADCAPRDSLGDGLINAADVVQVRRYATGLDPPVPANGPTTEPSFPLGSISALIDTFYSNFLGREIRVGSVKTENGSIVMVPVEITPFGDETAAGFTLVYDAAVLTNPHVELGEAAPKGAILTVNYDALGRIGIVIDSTEPMTASAMPRQFVSITFDVAKGSGSSTLIKITSDLAVKGISDASGNMLSTRWLDGVVSIIRRN